MTQAIDHAQDLATDLVLEKQEMREVIALMRKIASIATPHFTAGWGDGNCGWLLDKFKEILSEEGLYREESPASLRRKPLSQSLRRQVMERDRYRCLCCGTHKDLQIDHILPVSKGGTDDIDNLQTLCRRCNAEKMTAVIDYRQEVHHG